MYNKKAHYVDNFSDFLIFRIFLNVIFQTSYKKCFIEKENTHNKTDLYINDISRF